MPYVYEARPRKGVERPKHKWKNPFAGVAKGRAGELVGMCPSGITSETLEHLLNSGIHWHKGGVPKEHPDAIYNVHDGVPYRAITTQAGKSFHGFPCISRKKDVPPSVHAALIVKAEELGMKKQVEKWFKEHP